MDCLFLHDKSDICSDRFEEALKQSGASYARMTYSELASQSLPIPKLEVDSSTRLFARFPNGSLTDRNNDMLLSMVIKMYDFSYVFDEKIYQESSQKYEDKLYHSYLYEKLDIPYAQVLNRNQLKSNDFPLIVKRRQSCLGKGNVLLKSEKELETLIKKKDLSHFVFQKFYELAGDYRVILLGDDLIGVVSRKVIKYDDGHVGVKVGKAVDLPKNVIDWCRQIKLAVGGDFMGFDIGEKKDGTYFLIEHKLSAYFIGVERETGWDVARKVVEYVLKQ